MATYWIRSTGGDDLNPGTSYAAAKQTLSSGVALLTTKGDILNVVDEADYVWPLTEIDIASGAGTSFSDFGYLIRGVADAAETPAYATIATTGADAVRRCFRAQAGSGYLIFRNLIFDDTAKAADASAHTAVRINNATGPVWLDGCAFLAAATGVTHAGTHQLLSLQASAVDGSRIWDCYLQNMQSALHGITGATISISQIGNLFYYDVSANSPTVIARTLAAGTGDTFDFTFNTMYWALTDKILGSPISYSVGGTNAGVMNVNSNLFFAESTNAAPDIEFLVDSAAGVVPFSGTIGNNVFLGGPNITAPDVPAGWYEGTFDTGGDPRPTDQESFAQAEATVFNAPGSTYAWDALGNGATITILKDLRPRVFLTSGLGSTVPGALPAAETDYGIALATNNTAPEEGTAFTITVTASNSGSPATSVIMTALVPAGLTLVTATPSQGSYVAGTGIWTIGSMSSSDSETLALDVTVDTGQAGNTIVMSASTTSGDPATDPSAANNTATLSLPIPADEDDDPIQTVYLDVAPIFAPVLLAEINAITRTNRNRVDAHELRKDYERRIWREYAARRVTIAPSTTVSVVSAIERVDFFIMEATGDVEVSVSDSATDVFFPPSERLALLAGDFTTLKLRNPSATASVDALLVVID